MEPPPRSPPALPDEIVEEILLRSPPDDPASLVRAALVEKRWRRLVSSAGFRRRYREFHRTPPMLGVITFRSRSPFVSTSSFHPSHRDGSFKVNMSTLDARHGRVLLRGLCTSPRDDAQRGQRLRHLVVVWDPITGDRRVLPTVGQYLNCRICAGVVLCAAGGGACDHLDCHGRPFQVFIIMYNFEQMDAFVYSCETGAWRQLASLHCGRTPVESLLPGALVKNKLYFVFGAGTKLLRYNLASEEMSVINFPPAFHRRCYVHMTTEDGQLGFAILEDSMLRLWSKEADRDEDAGWTQNRVIDLQKLLPVDARVSTSLHLVAFADGVGVCFVDTDDRLFTIDLKSSQVKKVCNVTGNGYDNIFPNMSFWTPGSTLI
ncbi:unnamed protein product [Urochloa humidicola]